MAGPDLTLALDFCDGLRRWVELPKEMSVEKDHADIPSFEPPAGWPGDASFVGRFPLDEGLALGLFPLRKNPDSSKIECIAEKSLQELIKEHGQERVLKFLNHSGEALDSASLPKRVHVHDHKAMVGVRYMAHQIEMLSIFAEHADEIQAQEAAAVDMDLLGRWQRDLRLSGIRRQNAYRWMQHVIAHGATETCIEMLRAFSRLADKPDLLSRCVAGAEDLAWHMRPPIEAALTLRSHIMGCGTRLSIPSQAKSPQEPPVAYLKDQNRFLTLCQELKTRLERQRGDMEGQMESLIDKDKTYCLYGGSQLALRVMTRLRQKTPFRLLVIENEVKEVSDVRRPLKLSCPDWRAIRLGRLSATGKKESLGSVPTLFAGACCAVPEGAYVEAGLAETLSQAQNVNGLPRPKRSGPQPRLALVLGGHKFVRGQIGTPGLYVEQRLKPFHEFLAFDQVRYLVG